MTLPHPEHLPEFAEQIRGAERPLLALDYDGTLAEFHIDPGLAIPLPGIPKLLESIIEYGRTAVPIISGRPVTEVRCLLPLRAWYIGSHGREFCCPDGIVSELPVSPQQNTGLELAATLLTRRGLAGRPETKPASLALHTRGMDAQKEKDLLHTVEKLWAPLCPTYGLELLRFNGGLEIRALGINKGTALLEHLPEMSDHDLIVYLGDDTTDEDVFSILEPPHTGILIGSTRPTSARAHLPDCREVKAFLKNWLRYRHVPGSLDQGPTL